MADSFKEFEMLAKSVRGSGELTESLASDRLSICDAVLLSDDSGLAAWVDKDSPTPAAGIEIFTAATSGDIVLWLLFVAARATIGRVDDECVCELSPSSITWLGISVLTPSLPAAADPLLAEYVELPVLDVFLLTELAAILATLATELLASLEEIVCGHRAIFTSTDV